MPLDIAIKRRDTYTAMTEQLVIDVGRELADAQEEMRLAAERRRQADLEIEGLSRFIEALETIALHVKADGVQVTPDKTLWGEPSTRRPALSGGRAPGNRSAKTPPRQPAFINMSISQAATTVLQAAGGRPLHADDIAKRMYVIADLKDLQLVKRSIVSELHRLVKKGVVTKKGSNVFALSQ